MNVQYKRWCMAACLVIGCMVLQGCEHKGVKAISYGNVHFNGQKTFDSMSISPGPWPSHIEVVLSDGTQLTSKLSRDSVKGEFGEPMLAGAIDKGQTEYEEFGKAGCMFTFENGAFTGLYVDGVVDVVNLATGKSVSLPATESEIQAAFGNPTKVTYPQARQP